MHCMLCPPAALLAIILLLKVSHGGAIVTVLRSGPLLFSFIHTCQPSCLSKGFYHILRLSFVLWPLNLTWQGLKPDNSQLIQRVPDIATPYTGKCLFFVQIPWILVLQCWCNQKFNFWTTAILVSWSSHLLLLFLHPISISRAAANAKMSFLFYSHALSKVCRIFKWDAMKKNEPIWGK